MPPATNIPVVNGTYYLWVVVHYSAIGMKGRPNRTSEARSLRRNCYA
jgi:hypothetical protein